jgi:hypothetical protein
MGSTGLGLARQMAWVALLTLSLTAGVEAGPFTFSGTSSGTFNNPDPSSSLTSGVGTASFSWGDPGSTGSVSSLTFTGGGFTGQEGQIFTLGTLTYTNGVTFGGEPSSVDLNLKLSFTNPIMPDVPLTLTASIFTMPILGDPAQSSNTILFDFGQLTLLDGQTTTVPLLGMYDSDFGFQVFGLGDPIGSPGNPGQTMTPVPSTLLLAGLGLACIRLASGRASARR